MPGQESVRGDDTGDVGHAFPAKLLTLYREPTSLVVRGDASSREAEL